MSSADATSSLEHNLLRICCQTLDDKKAVDLKVLDVRAKSSLTDFLVIATGTSDPHLRALGGALKREFKNSGIPIIGSENDMKSGWLVVDAFDVMVHIFTPQMRELYRLEYLWKDAEVVDISAWLETPAPVAAASAKAEVVEKTAPAKPKAEKATKKAAPAKKAAVKKTAAKKTTAAKAPASKAAPAKKTVKATGAKAATAKAAPAAKADTAAKAKKPAVAKKTAKAAEKAPTKAVKKTATKKVAKKAATKK